MTYEVEAIKYLIDDLHLQMCERTIGGLNGSLGDVNKKYAASTTWDDKVARNMVSYYATISKSRSAALDRLK